MLWENEQDTIFGKKQRDTVLYIAYMGKST